MRKNNSKASNRHNGDPAKGRVRKELIQSRKASNGSRMSSPESAEGTTQKGSSRKSVAASGRPASQRDLVQQAIDLKNAKRYEEAIRVLKKAVTAKPDDGLAHFLLGGIYFAFLKEPKKAIPWFRKAIKLAPKSERASLGLFHSLWNVDKQADALEEMKRFQSISHSDDYAEILAEIREKWLDSQPAEEKP